MYLHYQNPYAKSAASVTIAEISCVHYGADNIDQNKKQKQQEQQPLQSQPPWKNREKD
jgi:hypothetical protein